MKYQGPNLIHRCVQSAVTARKQTKEPASSSRKVWKLERWGRASQAQRSDCAKAQRHKRAVHRKNGKYGGHETRGGWELKTLLRPNTEGPRITRHRGRISHNGHKEMVWASVFWRTGKGEVVPTGQRCICIVLCGFCSPVIDTKQSMVLSSRKGKGQPPLLPWIKKSETWIPPWKPTGKIQLICWGSQRTNGPSFRQSCFKCQ